MADRIRLPELTKPIMLFPRLFDLQRRQPPPGLLPDEGVDYPLPFNELL